MQQSRLRLKSRGPINRTLAKQFFKQVLRVQAQQDARFNLLCQKKKKIWKELNVRLDCFRDIRHALSDQ